MGGGGELAWIVHGELYTFIMFSLCISHAYFLVVVCYFEAAVDTWGAITKTFKNYLTVRFSLSQLMKLKSGN